MSLSLENKVINIVKKAAKLANHTFSVQQKSSEADIVTSSDIVVQNFLVQQLGSLVPQAGFLCEEKGATDTTKDMLWIIDPIDGTMNYARNIPDFAISVALVGKDAPILGVVYCPARNEVFSATVGEGARLNGKPIRVSDKPFGQALLCTATSVYNKQLAPVCFQIIEQVFPQCSDTRRFGSCAVELCYLAAGKCDLYFEIRVNPWDYAAAYIVLSEAGGILRGLHGQTLAFDCPTVLVGANNVENYQKLANVVSQHIATLPYEPTLD